MIITSNLDETTAERPTKMNPEPLILKSSHVKSNKPARAATPHSETSSPITAARDEPSGLILKTGRVRLPDKLMEYLNKEVAPEVLYWMPEGEAFAFDTEKAQEQFLDRYFSGTKVSSFLRSISRWGFMRVFYHTLEKQVYAFHHPLFKKGAPELEKDMKMVASTLSRSKKAKKAKMARQSSEDERDQSPPPVLLDTTPSLLHATKPKATLPAVRTSPSTLSTPAMLQTLATLGHQQNVAVAPLPPHLQNQVHQLLQQLTVIPRPLVDTGSALSQQPTNPITFPRIESPRLLHSVAAAAAVHNNNSGGSTFATLQLLEMALAQQQQAQQQQQCLDLIKLINSLRGRS